MIDRLSFSSLRCYLSDKQQFKKQYLDGQWDDMGDAVYIGKACHRMIEALLKNTTVPTAHDALAYESAELLKQRKTLEDVPAAIQETQTCFDSFLEYYHNYQDTFHPIVVEGKYIVYPEAVPYYLKGFVDTVHQNEDGRVTVMDWKTVARWTGEKGSMAHRLQAVFYMMLLEATDMTSNYTAQFVELHRKKRAYKVHTYTVEPEEIHAMRDLCTLAFDKITQNTNHFLPNPFSMFGGEESWQYFVQSRREE